MSLRAVLLLALVALSSAYVQHSAFLTRKATKSSDISCRLGDLDGEFSRRVDFIRGRICEKDGGREVCRKLSVNALGAHDDLDAEFAEVQDLPSWWILRAEEEFRFGQARNKNEQLE